MGTTPENLPDTKPSPHSPFDSLLNTTKPTKGTPPAKLSKKRSRVKWIVISVVGVVLAGLVNYLVAQQFGSAGPELVYYTVQNGPLEISVSERGIVESQEKFDIRCEVDDIDGDGIRGTPIRWIIRNGATVQKGDLLVELESQRHIERRDRQIIEREKAKAEKTQAEAKYENQLTQNITLEAEAELQVELADLELEMFKDEKIGTHKLELSEIERKIDDIKAEILTKEGELALAKQDLFATQSLAKMGYARPNELDRSKLDVLRAESALAAKMNSLDTQFAALTKKTTYEKEKQQKTLQGALETAKRKSKQVKLDSKALMAQAKADLDKAVQTFQKQDELLQRYEQDVKNCKIYAPIDGMIAYDVSDSRRWWESEIREGLPVRPKRTIMSIPNLSKMQVRTTVHESVIHQVRDGLPVTVRIEAFPDQTFNGKVKSVAVLADQRSPETRVYETVVTIDDVVTQIKPGMTAVAEIHIARLENVLSVPVQAIVQIGSESWCYVDNGDGPERRNVRLGMTNHKFVQIREGIKVGDRVVLNPMAIVEQSEDESVTSEDESSTETPSGPSPSIKPEDESSDKRPSQRSQGKRSPSRRRS
ncbi:MAG: efflux RND transporter periplasmic adaptor subunit [Gemmataceae bacterium]